MGQKRISSSQRRASVLAAAIRIFGSKGFAATTTADIAREAAVSQPYVVSLFGSKDALIRAAIEHALDRVVEVFEQTIDDDAPGDLAPRIGVAYLQLFKEQGLQLCLAHAFTAGTDPEIGPLARDGFLRVYRVLVNRGDLTPEQASQTLAAGMMANVILGLRLADDYDREPVIRELLSATYPSNVELLRTVTGAYDGVAPLQGEAGV
ncbi:TetR/AcrR family transcriptional regulator [Micromonospora sp. U21]|uniref:TetR/AcrR family transcriptional regulator n=1 Tax=Micromonospora sp. U21 TaxID=2824899 RepID=UPI001B364CF5|nr:TetR/AcrR family transcriptional regulator [Micromonospora sp. U21]MBQ0901635.1 TetR/AcrR family transcriptional regulator [Micromonospora sp. U21]